MRLMAPPMIGLPSWSRGIWADLLPEPEEEELLLLYPDILVSRWCVYLPVFVCRVVVAQETCGCCVSEKKLWRVAEGGFYTWPAARELSVM